MSILKQLLQTLQPTENFDDVLSEFQPSLAPCNVDYLYCGACKILEDIMDSVSSFSYLLSSDVLITIQSIVNSVVVLLDKSGEPNGKNIHMGCSKAIIPFLRKRLGYSAHKLLSADFPSEDAGKGWQSKGDLIQKILQIYLRNSDSTSDLLAEIGRELPKEPSLKTKDNQDVSYGFPTLCSSTITSWYRVLHEENTRSLNKTIKQALKARGSVDTILQEIQKSVDAFVSLIGMCKSHEKVSMHAMAVKHGGKFIDTFLKAFNFLERQFKQHNDTIVKMLKQLQKGTRIIQSICSDSKHKDLQGHVVSSQAYGNVDEEDEEQTEIDSDLPTDEHDNGNAMEEDAVEGTSLVIWSWRWPFHSWLPALILGGLQQCRSPGVWWREMDVTIREELQPPGMRQFRQQYTVRLKRMWAVGCAD
eukprot:XP_008665956.2 uncharacterized protein LOC103644546 [Zea mays]